MKLLDHPEGDEFDLDIIFVPNNLHIKIAYKLAWKENTRLILFFIKVFINKKIQIIYFLNLPFFLQKFDLG